MQYTTHYNLNLPEGPDIVNPLIQDNPNYSAIDTALYDNKLRVIGNATHTKTGTNHSIVLADSDIPVFRFVATGDYTTGDTFSVDGVTVTTTMSDGSALNNHAFVINSTILCVLDGTKLNIVNPTGNIMAQNVKMNDNTTVESNITSLNARLEVSSSTESYATDNGGNAGPISSSDKVLAVMPTAGFRIKSCFNSYGSLYVETDIISGSVALKILREVN